MISQWIQWSTGWIYFIPATTAQSYCCSHHDGHSTFTVTDLDCCKFIIISLWPNLLSQPYPLAPYGGNPPRDASAPILEGLHNFTTDPPPLTPRVLFPNQITCNFEIYIPPDPPSTSSSPLSSLTQTPVDTPKMAAPFYMPATSRCNNVPYPSPSIILFRTSHPFFCVPSPSVYSVAPIHPSSCVSGTLPYVFNKQVETCGLSSPPNLLTRNPEVKWTWVV